MKERIVKTFMGIWLDLEQVTAISDAKFINEMGFGGYFVGFYITCSTSMRHGDAITHTIPYRRQMLHGVDYEYVPHEKRLTGGSEFMFSQLGTKEKVNSMDIGKDSSKIPSMVELQNQINDLVKQWKEYHNDMMSRMLGRFPS